MRLALIVVAACTADAAPAVKVVDAGAGWRFGCALLDDTTVRCFGEGIDGSVGDGTGYVRNRPVAVIDTEDSVTQGTTGKPLTGAIGLAVGDRHACALLEGGTVRCWGGGAWSPRKVAVDHVVEIAAGRWVTCARHDDGAITCWREITATRKIVTHAISVGKAVKLAIGDSNPCAVLADGTVACWPDDLKTLTAADQGVTDVVDAWPGASKGGGCAKKKSGDIACWGGVKAPPKNTAFASFHDGEHCVIDDKGEASCSGHYPFRLAGVRRVSPGGTASCLVMTNGELRCWGSTDYGQLGDGGGRTRSAVAQVQSIAKADALWVGYASCARVAGGHVSCWGPNGDDQLGPNAPEHYAAAPNRFAELDGATQVSIADQLGCALHGADLTCWGKDSHGKPAVVSGVEHAKEIAVAQEHACARLDDDTVTCWGDSFGALGRGGVVRDGEYGPYPPAKVKDVKDVAQLVAGTASTCALLKSGKVRCWGTSGFIGDGSRRVEQWVTTPTTVKGITDATFIAINTDGTSACAVRKDHSLTCWGRDSYGELGDFDRELDVTPEKLVPVVAKWVKDAATVAIGNGSTCVLTTGGDVQCFGGNQYGECADGTTEVRVKPVKVMADAVDVGAVENTMCARKRDGTVWCWGQGDFGRVGDAAPNLRETPYPVTF